MTVLDNIIKRAQASPKRIVLPEGEDERIIRAAERLSNDRIADVTLVGNVAIIETKASKLGVNLANVSIVDPLVSPLRESLTALLFARRSKKGMTQEKAFELAGQPLWFANLSVKAGHQDGVVSGAVHSTGDVVRAALQVIGVDKSFKMISSFFLMVLDQPHHPRQGSMVFSDCGLVIDPDAQQLAEIASAAANSYQSLNDEPAKVAMLSFSTQGSASHQDVDKVVEATRLVRLARPELEIDGEVQLDAAILPTVAASKIKNSAVKGAANVLVFPSLEAGNIAYKLVERFAGATAVGPLLQGLAQPANDLSRGCSADDVYYVAAVTVLQAQT